jgi:hypothetical protein
VTETGQKFDGEKPRMDLIDPSFQIALADVLTYGAREYSAHNWRNGIDASRLYAALQRHLLAFWGGEDIDDESGLPHLSHAACELMFLQWMIYEKPEHDDRWERGE